MIRYKLDGLFCAMHFHMHTTRWCGKECARGHQPSVCSTSEIRSMLHWRALAEVSHPLVVNISLMHETHRQASIMESSRSICNTLAPHSIHRHKELSVHTCSSHCLWTPVTQHEDDSVHRRSVGVHTCGSLNSQSAECRHPQLTIHGHQSHGM